MREDCRLQRAAPFQSTKFGFWWTDDLGLRAHCLVQCRAQSPSKFQCIVVSPEVQEEQSGLLVQHMAVDGSHIDAIRPQRLNHGIYFVACENVP